MPRRTEYPAYVVMEIGARVAQRLKNQLFPEKTWDVSLTKEVARMLSKLRRKAKIYYPILDDKDLLNEITKWNAEDIREGLDETTE